MGNAVKFTAEGHVLLTVRLQVDPAKGSGGAHTPRQTAWNVLAPSRRSMGRGREFDRQSIEAQRKGMEEVVSGGGGWEDMEASTLSGKWAADDSGTAESVHRMMEEDEWYLKRGGEGGEEKKHEGPVHREVTLLFSVEDTGAGIPPAAGDRVFAPFAKLHNSATKSSGGAGIGLSLAQRSVAVSIRPPPAMNCFAPP